MWSFACAPAAVKAWAAGISEALGETGLNLLISNAGILTPGPLEVLPLDAVRREFEVNVFGALSLAASCSNIAAKAASGARDDRGSAGLF
jgi:NAD(P)-dependent dehydrogenase (short-subunit alcohol dehydrogenase family)